MSSKKCCVFASPNVSRDKVGTFEAIQCERRRQFSERVDAVAAASAF